MTYPDAERPFAFDAMTYGIFCTVASGVTGSRSSYLKEDGAIRHFSTLADAEAEAARLTKAMNGPHARACFYYRAVELAALRA